MGQRSAEFEIQLRPPAIAGVDNVHVYTQQIVTTQVHAAFN